MSVKRPCPCGALTLSPGYAHVLCKCCGWIVHAKDQPYPRGFVCAGCEVENAAAQKADVAKYHDPSRGWRPVTASDLDPVEVLDENEARVGPGGGGGGGG